MTAVDEDQKIASEPMGEERAVSWRSNPTDLRALAGTLRQDLNLTEFRHDPEWLGAESTGGADKVTTLTASLEAKTLGVLVTRASRARFEYSAGARPLFGKDLLQFTIHQGPVVAASLGAHDVENSFVELSKNMPNGSVAYLSAVPIGSHTHAAFTDSGSRLLRSFYVLPWGRQNPHYKIKWEGTVEKYLASISAKRRGNVKRASQRTTGTAKFQLRTFRSPSEIEAFLHHANSISAKSNDPELKVLQPGSGRLGLIRFAGAQDAFVGYVLYADEVPVAYRYGFIYGPTLFAIATAYDPDWSEHKPGAVIFYEMLKDLEETRAPISLIDLLPHDNTFKRDRANVTIPTQNFYLLKRNVSGAALYLPIHLLESCKPVAKRMRSMFAKRAI
jgi:hypothetical protein